MVYCWKDCKNVIKHNKFRQSRFFCLFFRLCKLLPEILSLGLESSVSTNKRNFFIVFFFIFIFHTWKVFEPWNIRKIFLELVFSFLCSEGFWALKYKQNLFRVGFLVFWDRRVFEPWNIRKIRSWKVPFPEI